MGRLVYLDDYLISYQAKRIRTFVASKFYAEYIAARKKAEGFKWLRTLLE